VTLKLTLFLLLLSHPVFALELSGERRDIPEPGDCLTQPKIGNIGTTLPRYLQNQFHRVKTLASHVMEAVHHIHDPCMEKIIARGGLDPSVKDMSKEICSSNDHCVLKAALDEAWKEELKSESVPVEVMYAVVLKESTWQHWDRKRLLLTDGNVLLSYDRSSHGLMQINANHESEVGAAGWEKIMHDPLSNAREGMKLFKKYMNGLKSTFSGEQLYIKTYSGYMGGGGSEFTSLFRDHLHTGAWSEFTNGCPKL